MENSEIVDEFSLKMLTIKTVEIDYYAEDWNTILKYSLYTGLHKYYFVYKEAQCELNINV